MHSPSRTGFIKPHLLLLTSLFLILISSCKSGNDPEDRGADCAAPNIFTIVDEIRPTNLSEPSGIVFHEIRNTLYVVEDEGDVVEVALDGTTVDREQVRQADFEGITVDPSTGLLYIVIEDESLVLEVDPGNFDVEEEYLIDWTLSGSPVINSEALAIEGITFRPDSQHVQGGVFYLANKSSLIDDPDNPSAIFEVELPIKDQSNGSTGRVIRSIPLQLGSVSGLHYDAVTNGFLAVSDNRNAVFSLGLNGDIRSCYRIPGTQQEGIAFDTTGSAYIVDDAGGLIYKMR
ncbi:MAG: SdiA-regulated domain-containing protein [Calditrichia bacterium]